MNIYKESQKFTQQWLFLTIFVILSAISYAIVQQVFLNHPFGSKPMPNSMLILSFLFVTVLMILQYAIRLITIASDKEILIKFVPFLTKKISCSDIKTLELVEYQFLGYGIRKSFKYGTVYNINGNKGLFIEQVNGKKFLIGTQNEEELKLFVNSLKILLKLI